jgi:hypothetical protein
MTLPGLAYAQPYPGATTCVVVGRFGSAVIPGLRSFRAVLWFVDSEGLPQPPPGLAPDALQTAPLEQLDSRRLAALLEQFVRHDARHLPSVFVTDDALQQHTEAYQSVLTTTCAQLESHHRTRTARQKDGFAWQKHVLQNVPSYAGRRLPASWRGALRGLPAFVCGSGPSLDVSAPQLTAHAARGVVLAADSALRTLARHGIAADIAVSIDADKSPDKCVPADRPPERAVLSIVSPPAWMSALPPDCICFAASRQITTAWLAEVGVAWPDMAVAEHWGGTALELARYLGCAPLYLFGLDLSLDASEPARRHTAYAEPSLYADSGFDAAQRFPEVPGNYAKSVSTHLIDDWRILDARLAGWPVGLVFNVTDRGAWLSNTTLVHPDNFSLPAAAGDKADLLARLGSPDAADPAVVDAAFSQVRETGRRERASVAVLRAELAKGGPPAVAAAFRPLFADKMLGQVLGAFSLKIMPHLMPPLEGDAAFWSSLIEEYAEVLALAETVR